MFGAQHAEALRHGREAVALGRASSVTQHGPLGQSAPAAAGGLVADGAEQARRALDGGRVAPGPLSVPAWSPGWQWAAG